MRWIRNIFALFAITCVMLWIVSYCYIVSAGVPLWGDDSQSMMTAAVGRTSIGTSYASPPNWPTDWRVEYQSIDEYRDNINLVRSFGMDLKLLWEYLPYGYKPY